MSQQRYLFDNAAEQAGQRFASLEAVFDPWTESRLARVGVGPGWRCLEIGGGGGSIAGWLAERVGADGHVLVTDLDPRYLIGLATRGLPNVEVRQHNIVTDPLPENAFDLIHERLVLIHLAEREAVVRKLVAALRPGGWLVLEDFASPMIDRTWPVANADDAALFAKAFPALRQMLMQRGADTTWAPRVHQVLRAAGLVDIGAAGFFMLTPGGTPGALVDSANFSQVRAEAVASGLLRDAEIDRILALNDDPNFAISSNVLISTWGRRPA
jgi:ubiquinone/menaquinone biosynthesis C-methylase UbiE